MSRGTWVDIKTTGLDDLVREFERLSNPKECETIFKRVCYEGMNVMADYMRSQLQALKTTKQTKANKNEKRYCTEREKAILLKEMGVTPIKEDYGGYNAKVGFDGYYVNSRGNEVPVPLLANSINHGTSFMHYQHFIDRSKRGGQAKTIEAMREALDREIAERTR